MKSSSTKDSVAMIYKIKQEDRAGCDILKIFTKK